MVGDEGEGPGEDGHVGPLEEWPFPGVGFAADDGDGADALEGEDVEDHDGDADERSVNERAVVATLFFECVGDGIGVVVRGADVVNGAHGADEDFARGEGGHDADADFPIETERANDRFDQVAEASGETVAEFRAGFIVIDGG